MKSERDDPDLPLLESIASGDSDAFEKLYLRHRAYLLEYLQHQLDDHETAEETLQNLMIVIWRSAAHFRRLSRVRTWMIAIARRQALKTMHTPLELTLDETMITEDTPTGQWQHDRIERLQAALLKIPRNEREALEIVYYEELRLAQAAERLGIPVNTLKSRLHRARKNLRELMAEDDDA